MNHLFREEVRKIFAAVHIAVPPSSEVVAVISSLVVEVGVVEPVPSPGTVDNPDIAEAGPATADFAAAGMVVVADIGMVAAVVADKVASAVAGRARINLYHSYHKIAPPLATELHTGDKVPFVVAYA